MVDKKVLLDYGAYNMVEAALEQARPQPNNQMGSLSLVVLRLLLASHVKQRNGKAITPHEGWMTRDERRT